MLKRQAQRIFRDLWQSKPPFRTDTIARACMYLEYYGLEQPPFSITPDPHYVFLSEHHRDALAHLLYGIRQGGGGGFVQLTGEVGTGKTTLSRLLLNQLPENTHAALVLNPRLDPIELLETICEELRLRPTSSATSDVSVNAPTNAPTDASTDTSTSTPAAAEVPGGKRRKHAAGKASTAKASAAKPPTKQAPKQTAKPSAKALYDLLSAYLLQAYARGERVVLIIDEAQNLSIEALEQVRLLTNLETETRKLLQIILIGQPELRETLMRPDLRQLAQRITARYHLRPLDEAGTAAYLRHRLNTAGTGRFPFSQDAVRRLHRRSGGVPRLINVVAERALLGGYAHDLLMIDAKTVDRAADEALAPTAANGSPRRRMLLQAALLTAIVIGFTLILMRWPTTSDAERTTTEAAAAATDDETIDATRPIAASASAASIIPTTNAAATAPQPDSGVEFLLQRIRSAATSPSTSTSTSTPTSALKNSEWSSLLKAWKAPAALRKVSADACPTVPAPGWRCLRSRASLDQLLRLDRPVLLRLRAEPHAAWARLLSADGERVRLSLDTGARENGSRDKNAPTLLIDRVALAGVWNGEFLAIWPAPEALETRYAAGDAAAIAWVRERLRRDGADVGVDANKADDDHTAALRAFQAQQGLLSDGRLHADTVFALSARSDGPRMAATVADDSVE
jgi:general secretion pathway protein A